MSADESRALARAWAEFEAELALDRMLAVAKRDAAVVHLPDVMGGHRSNRLVLLPPMGFKGPGGRCSVLT